MKKLLILFTCLAVFASACTPPISLIEFVIVPEKCDLIPGEELSISVEGYMPTTGEIVWSTTKGEITPPTGVNVIYTAPQETGSVIITALLETEDGKYSKTLACKVIAPDSTSINTPLPATVLPITPTNDTITIAITEVMDTPCDGLLGPNKNEYIELFNYGNNDVDVNGLWIATGPGGEGTPDQITSWSTINPGISLGNHVVTNSTIIPPNGFAIVISPRYYIGGGNQHMPYIFPNRTTILSLSNSNYLGNDNKGLIGTDFPLSTLILYVGSHLVMDKVISTYGTPSYGSSPNNVVDDGLDKFPYPVYNCQSMERIVASSEDLIGNWKNIDEGNPGEGDY